jgi:hypothetical protein
MWATCLSTPLLALWPNVSDYIIYQIFMKFTVGVCYKHCYLRVSFVPANWLSDSPTLLSFYPYFQHVLTAEGRIWYRRSPQNAAGQHCNPHIHVQLGIYTSESLLTFWIINVKLMCSLNRSQGVPHKNAVTMKTRNLRTGFYDPIILTIIMAYSHLVNKSLIFHTALYYWTSLHVHHLQVFTLYLLCIRHCHCFVRAGLCLT